MEHTCQLTNLIANSQLLKPFLDDCRPIFLKFLTTSPLSPFFNRAIVSMRTKNFLIEENIHFLIQNVCGLIVIIGKNT